MDDNKKILYKVCDSDSDFKIAEDLFLEYSKSLGFELDFQNFVEELQFLKVKYSSPEGTLLLAFEGQLPVGCVAVRKLESDTCELKRLYVRPDKRNLNIGYQLTSLAIDEAKKLGYMKIKLDTLDTMQPAISLYRKLGFVETEPYCFNPFEGAIYMEKLLKQEWSLI